VKWGNHVTLWTWPNLTLHFTRLQVAIRFICYVKGSHSTTMFTQNNDECKECMTGMNIPKWVPFSVFHRYVLFKDNYFLPKNEHAFCIYFLQIHKYLLLHHSVKEYSIIQLGPNSSFKLIKLQVTVYHWQRENYCQTFCAVSPAWHRNRDFFPCYRGERWPGHHRDKQRCSNLWCTTRPLIAFTAI